MTLPAPPPNILGAVDAVAVQYGVPTNIWETVAYQESAYDPQKVGDQGTSFGLFQLHQGGQLPAQYNSNPQVVFDPSLNAQIAMPAIARAWNSLKGSFQANNIGWWQQFAAQSGHPGGSPGQQTTNAEAQNLMTAYTGLPGTGDPCLGCGTVGSAAYSACHAALAAKVGNPPTCAAAGINQNQAAIGVPLTPVGGIVGQIEGIITQALPIVGIFLFALILIFIGFRLTVK
jgi:hypothetical protein